MAVITGGRRSWCSLVEEVHGDHWRRRIVGITGGELVFT
jgi:hypothetical protein